MYLEYRVRHYLQPVGYPAVLREHFLRYEGNIIVGEIHVSKQVEEKNVIKEGAIEPLHFDPRLYLASQEAGYGSGSSSNSISCNLFRIIKKHFDKLLTFTLQYIHVC